MLGPLRSWWEILGTGETSAAAMPGVAGGCWLALGEPWVFFCLFVFPGKTHSHEKGEQTEDAPSAFVSFQININTFTSKVYEHFLWQKKIRRGQHIIRYKW